MYGNLEATRKGFWFAPGSVPLVVVPLAPVAGPSASSSSQLANENASSSSSKKKAKRKADTFSTTLSSPDMAFSKLLYPPFLATARKLDSSPHPDPRLSSLFRHPPPSPKHPMTDSDGWHPPHSWIKAVFQDQDANVHALTTPAWRSFLEDDGAPDAKKSDLQVTKKQEERQQKRQKVGQDARGGHIFSTRGLQKGDEPLRGRWGEGLLHESSLTSSPALKAEIAYELHRLNFEFTALDVTVTSHLEGSVLALRRHKFLQIFDHRFYMGAADVTSSDPRNFNDTDHLATLRPWFRLLGEWPTRPAEWRGVDILMLDYGSRLKFEPDMAKLYDRTFALRFKRWHVVPVARPNTLVLHGQA